MVALREWAIQIQEPEFQTIASETVHGLSVKVGTSQQTQSFHRNKNQRTFFGESRKNRGMQNMLCQACGGRHAIWRCQQFAQKHLNERWNIAKRTQLCYRCLGEGHQGKSCPSSRPCGKNGCQELLHRLLHQHDRHSESTVPKSEHP